MKKEYIYNPRDYFIQITLIGYFCILVFIFSLVMIGINFHPSLFVIAALVAGYTVLNTFISRSNPSKIILEEDSISFESYGKKDTYMFTKITTFLAKDFRGSGKIFLRINKYNLLRGRFWIHTRAFNDSYELFLFLLKLEYKTHPESMKARAWDSTRPEVDKMPVLPWNLPQKQEVPKYGGNNAF